MANRYTAWAGVGALLLSLAVSLAGPVTAVAAADAPCETEFEQPVVRPVAPASAAEGLAEPFAFPAGPRDHQAVLADVVAVVQKQAADLNLDDCFRVKPMRIASRVDFLSPFEFLVVSTLDQDPARRDALLDQYKVDPTGAIKAIGDVYPSTRAQAAMSTFAYYDLANGHIRVNAAKVPPAEVRRVLVHEFWHAMPIAQTWSGPDGRTLRASGFWLQERRAGVRSWIPVEDRQGLPYTSSLMDEAMATLMENRYAGSATSPSSDLDEAQRFLDRLIGVAGTSAVFGDYLHSQPYEIGSLAEAHRASFPELEPVARP
jgi:hypothetical protein